MLKLMGALLITASGGVLGFKKSDSLKKRAIEAEKVIGALTLLENEISYGKRDIKSIILKIGDIQNLPVFSAAAKNAEALTIEEALSQAVKGQDCHMLKRDYDALRELFCELGKTDTKSQLKSIEYTRCRFRDIKNEAEKCYAASGRLYRGMGVLLGAMAAVILL